MSVASQADRFKRIAYRHRNIPGRFGLRPHTVSLVSDAWTGAQTGDGTDAPVSVALVERDGLPPKVRWASQKEIALGGLASGTVTIGPITPDFSAGGTTLAALTGSSVSAGNTFHLVITGPQHPAGAKYEIISTIADHSLHYTITACPVSAA